MVDNLIPIPEAAEIAGVHERTIRRWLAEGKLQSFQTGVGLKKYIRRADVERLRVPVPVVLASKRVK